MAPGAYQGVESSGKPGTNQSLRKDLSDISQFDPALRHCCCPDIRMVAGRLPALSRLFQRISASMAPLRSQTPSDVNSAMIEFGVFVSVLNFFTIKE